MLTNDLVEIYRIIKEEGIEQALNITDIEAIEDLSIKIIFRTIKTSHENLLLEIEDALVINT